MLHPNVNFRCLNFANDSKEIECNKLLMPNSFVKIWANRILETEALAEIFDVSHNAMIVRLDAYFKEKII